MRASRSTPGAPGCRARAGGERPGRSGVLARPRLPHGPPVWTIREAGRVSARPRRFEMHRVLLVEDHESFKESLAIVLNREPDFEVAGQARTLKET